MLDLFNELSNVFSEAIVYIFGLPGILLLQRHSHLQIVSIELLVVFDAVTVGQVVRKAFQVFLEPIEEILLHDLVLFKYPLPFQLVSDLPNQFLENVDLLF